MIPLSELKNIVVHGVEANTEYLQRRSLYLAKKEAKEENLSSPYKPKEIVSSPSKNLVGVLGDSDRWVYVETDFPTYGASQSTIAEFSHCSKSTVQRRLSYTHRVTKLKLSPVCKKQFRVRIDKEFVQTLWKSKTLKDKLNRVTLKDQEFWYSGTNVYDLGVILLKNKSLRKTFLRSTPLI